MKGPLFFRIAAVLIVFFAAGHTFGFRKSDPSWGIDSVLAAMRTIHFRTQGFNRTYWDFYVGFGLFVTVLLLFAAITAWQLGAAPLLQWTLFRPIAWALTACFAGIVYLSWRYFFATPVVFSTLIFLCLLLGTILAERAAGLAGSH